MGFLNRVRDWWRRLKLERQRRKKWVAWNRKYDRMSLDEKLEWSGRAMKHALKDNPESRRRLNRLLGIPENFGLENDEAEKVQSQS